MTYAHLINQTTISTTAPRQAVIDGCFVTGELPESYYNSQRWYRLMETPMPDTQDGYHAEPRYAYDSEEKPTRIVQSWEVVQDPPPPPRVFSKLKLKGAIATAGLLPAFKELLAGMEVAPGYTAQEAFDDAVNLSEANEGFKAAAQAAKTALGVTDEDVERILAASVAD